MELKRKNRFVYLLNYHLILGVKYRQKVFVDDEMIEYVKDVFRNVSKDFDVDIINQECGIDHWSDSYYLATAGDVSVDTLYKYIENQRKKI